MNKVHYILIVGVFFLLLSVFSFTFLREDVTPSCINSITCGTALNYFDLLEPLKLCTADCQMNTNEQSFNVPNQIFVLFVWIGIMFVGLWILVQGVLFAIKLFKEKFRA